MRKHLPITNMTLDERKAKRAKAFAAIRRSLADLTATVDDQLGVIPSDAFLSINRSLTRLIHEVSTWDEDGQRL